MQENINKKKKAIKIVIILCLCLICILILLLALLPKNKPAEVKSESNQIENETREEMVSDYVRVRGEKERIEVYLAEFIKYIETQDYDLAYNKLYPEFKENFFKTESEFESYAKRNYSSLMMIDYEDVQRQGNYYILSVKITSLDGVEWEKTMKYVIQENGINEYYISFQVDF